MQINIIHLTIYFTFYIIGAYATTDILRLLKGCSVSINEPYCYCPICHNRIALKDQLPIVSYLKNHGHCSTCKSSIPVSDLFMEIFLFLSLSVISTFFDFNWLAYALCILCYEGTKIAFILFHGHREEHFGKNLLISLGNNIIIFFLVALLFLIAHLV